MPSQPLTDADRELIEAANDAIEAHFVEGRHRVSAAVRTTSGNVYTAINLIPSTGTAATHAEPIAIEKAIRNGEDAFDTVVSVKYDPSVSEPFRVVSSCGTCRELMRDFAPDVLVIVPDNGELVKRPLSELLPAR